MRLLRQELETMRVLRRVGASELADLLVVKRRVAEPDQTFERIAQRTRTRTVTTHRVAAARSSPAGRPAGALPADQYAKHDRAANQK
jgi:hypothetical protein